MKLEILVRREDGGGGWDLTKLPSVGEVWIVSGTTGYHEQKMQSTLCHPVAHFDDLTLTCKLVIERGIKVISDHTS